MGIPENIFSFLLIISLTYSHIDHHNKEEHFDENHNELHRNNLFGIPHCF